MPTGGVHGGRRRPQRPPAAGGGRARGARAGGRYAAGAAGAEKAASRRPARAGGAEVAHAPYPEKDAAVYGHYMARGVPDELVERVSDATVTAIFKRVAPCVPDTVVFPWPEKADASAAALAAAERDHHSRVNAADALTRWRSSG